MRTPVLFLASVVACGGSAFAQTPGAQRFREVFLQLDANGDSVLERDEVPESGKAAFDRLLNRGDANKNGKLEADELRVLGQKVAVLNDPEVAADRFKAMDKDGDGKVMRSEFKGIPANFDRIDADKNGSLTAEELTRFARPRIAEPRPAAKVKAAARAEEKAKKDEAKKPDPTKEEKPSEKPKPSPAKPEDETADPALRFKRLDKNSDGKITRDEFPRGKLFERMDLDRDGALTKAELEKFMKGPG